MDKRICWRQPVRIGCWIVEMDGLACVQTYDISDNGVCVFSSEPIPVGREVKLQFFTPQSASPVHVEAEVVWSKESGDSYSMGLKFLALEIAALQAIRQFAAYLHHLGKRQSLE